MSHLASLVPNSQDQDQDWGVVCYPPLKLLGSVFNAFHIIATQ